jgi:hypothetical protein
VIYFLQATDGGPVKIGHANDVELRHRQLESHYGRRLVLLAQMPGGHAEELAIHKRFASLRLGKTEQFRPGPKLMAFIGRPLLANPNPDSIEAMDKATVEVRLSLDREFYGRIKAIADAECNSIATIIRRSVARELRQLEKEYAP